MVRLECLVVSLRPGFGRGDRRPEERLLYRPSGNRQLPSDFPSDRIDNRVGSERDNRSMTSDPWALPAHFYSIIIKRQAIIRSFPGGVGEFERVHSPGKNGALFQIGCMSHQDTDYVLSQLNDAGLRYSHLASDTLLAALEGGSANLANI